MNWYSIDELASEKHLPLWAAEACVNREDFPKDGFRWTRQPKHGLENDGFYYWGEFELIEEDVLEVRKDIFEGYWQKLVKYSQSLPLKTKNKGFYSQGEFDVLTWGWYALRFNTDSLSYRKDDYTLGKNSSGRRALFIKKTLLHLLLIEFFNRLDDNGQNEIRGQLKQKKLCVVNDKIRIGCISLELASLNSCLFESRLSEVFLAVRESTQLRKIPLWVIAVPA